MTAKTFPRPSKPRSFKKFVKKIITDPDFAKFVHGQLRKARKGDAAAAATLAAHFHPQPSELSALNLTESSPARCHNTNPTTLNIIGFVAHV